MKTRKIMVEIVCIVIVGLITIWLSLNSLSKEKELKEANKSLTIKQDLLFELQNKHAIELKEKTDEIIDLQKILQEKSDFQLKSLDKLNNPIPDAFEITFTSTVDLSKSEIYQIGEILNSIASTHGNQLPINTDKNNEGIEKINYFKNISFRLIITFNNKGKKMEIMFTRGPLDLHGYNTTSSNNSFILAYQKDKSIVMFDGLFLQSSDITTNYKTPSFLDFEHSAVSISYEFAYPGKIQIGSIPTTVYFGNNQNYITLNINSLMLRNQKHTLNISNLKRIDTHNFVGIWEGEKDKLPN